MAKEAINHYISADLKGHAALLTEGVQGEVMHSPLCAPPPELPLLLGKYIPHCASGPRPEQRPECGGRRFRREAWECGAGAAGCGGRWETGEVAARRGWRGATSAGIGSVCSGHRVWALNTPGPPTPQAACSPTPYPDRQHVFSALSTRSSPVSSQYPLLHGAESSYPVVACQSQGRLGLRWAPGHTSACVSLHSTTSHSPLVHLSPG